MLFLGPYKTVHDSRLYHAFQGTSFQVRLLFERRKRPLAFMHPNEIENRDRGQQSNK